MAWVTFAHRLNREPDDVSVDADAQAFSVNFKTVEESLREVGLDLRDSGITEAWVAWLGAVSDSWTWIQHLQLRAGNSSEMREAYEGCAKQLALTRGERVQTIASAFSNEASVPNDETSMASGQDPRKILNDAVEVIKQCYNRLGVYEDAVRAALRTFSL